jgi:Holin of 3TMs, for gene-transfer release
MASSLIVPVIGQAFDGLTKIIGEFHMSPEEKAKAQQAIVDAQQKAQQAAVDYDVQLNTIAGQNIRADDATGDKFTQHARPWFMYIVELVLAFNYIVIPLVQAVLGKPLAPMTLPADLLTLFGVCVTGYVFNRTAEKVASMPGDSQVRLPFGLGGVSNKS